MQNFQKNLQGYMPIHKSYHQSHMLYNIHRDTDGCNMCKLSTVLYVNNIETITSV